MAGKSDAHSTAVLNVLRGTTLTGIGTVYVGLFTAAPTDAGGGTEVTDGTPDRESAAFTAPVAASPGMKIDNSAAVSWTSWPNASDTLVAAALFDALTVGTLLYWANLDDNRTINSGETATFATGALVVSED